MKLSKIGLFVFLGFSACNISNQQKGGILIQKFNLRYKNETVHFGQYLSKKFGENLKADSAYYFLISETGCPSCVKSVISAYKKNRKTMFIMSPTSRIKFLREIHDDNNVYIDSSGEIDRLAYHSGNIGIIATSSKNIDTIVTLEPSTLIAQVSSVNIH